MMMMSAVLNSPSTAKRLPSASVTASLATPKVYRDAGGYKGDGMANPFQVATPQQEVERLFVQALEASLPLATIEQALVHLAPNAKQLLPYLASPHTAQVSLATMAVLRLGYRYEVQQWLQQSSSVSLWVRQFLSHQFSLSA